MKTLKTIQTISKIARIVSKVIFVFCIVGFCMSVVGVVGLAIGAQSMQLAGVTLQGVLQTEADTSTGSLYAALAESIILCVGGAVLSKFALHYFERELEDGTPFTHRGAKELLRLGILTIAIPTCLSLISAIGVGIANNFDPTIKDLSVGSFGSVGLGIMMIFTSII